MSKDPTTAPARGAVRHRCGPVLLAAALLAGCATAFDNQPQNAPISAGFVAQMAQDRGIVGENTIGLSLSGGGLRAAAFSLGVLQALTEAGAARTDLFDDVAFLSSVSGGSLTAAHVALHGRAGLDTFRARVLDRDLERDLRLNLLWPTNLARLLAGGINDRSNLAATLDADVFGGATFADLYRRVCDGWPQGTVPPAFYQVPPAPMPVLANALPLSSSLLLPLGSALATNALACAAMALNASGSCTARSARTLRSTSIPAFARPLMKRE